MAEFAIPFKSLSYEPGQTTWGFDVARRIYHKNERVHWSDYNPALDFTDVSQTGDLVGIENVSQGIGLDVQVYGALRAKHDWQLEGDGAGLSFHRGRQRVLQGDAGAHQHADRQSRFLRCAARHPPGEHDAVLAVHAGNARFLPPGRVGVRIRRAQLRPQLAGPRVEQRAAVLLAQYRPRARGGR